MIFFVFRDVSWHPRLSQSAWRRVSSAHLEDRMAEMPQPWHMAFSGQEPSVGITNWSNNCYLSAVRDLAFSTMELTSDALVFDGKFMGISTLSHLESDDFCSPVQLRGRMRTKPSQTSLPNQIKNMSQNSHNRGHNGQMVKLW